MSRAPGPRGTPGIGPRPPGRRAPHRAPRVHIPGPDDAPETEIRPARPVRSWRPRMTGRAAVLVLVLAVLTVSYASSLKAYLQQRQHISELNAQIDRSEADIDALEREKSRWRDPAYVESQARARFGYVMPGETSYVVLDADGKPLESQSALVPKKDVLVKEPTAWFETAWESVLLAGTPPPSVDKPEPLRHIDAPKQSG
jgi:cell division protein FtsB